MRSRTFLLAVTLSLAFATVAIAQSFDNPKVEYTLDMPSPSWHLSSVPDDVSQAVEFINGQDRGDGLLKIRKMVKTCDTNGVMLMVSRIVSRDESKAWCCRMNIQMEASQWPA